jgi:hypothetical protein
MTLNDTAILLDKVHEEQRKEYLEALGQVKKPINLAALWDELVLTKSYMRAFEDYCRDEHPREPDAFSRKIINYTLKKAEEFNLTQADYRVGDIDGTKSIQ